MTDPVRAVKPQHRPDQLSVKNLLKVPAYIVSGIKYHAAGHIFIPKPVYTTLHLTRRCNSRCIMCSDWRRQTGGKELTAVEIKEIFSHPLFDSLEKFTLSGGEPTLRDDLVEIADIVLNACPRLKDIVITTNGLETSLVIKQIEKILALPQLYSPDRLSVQISLDGYGAVHEKIRRVPHAFERVVETIRILKELQSKYPFNLVITCVVQPLNIDNLVQLAQFGQEIGVPVSFIPVDLKMLSDSSYAPGKSDDQDVTLTDKHLEKLKMLIENQLKPYLKPSNIPFWQEYFKIVSGRRRRLPCFFLHHYVGVDSDGTLYLCSGDVPSLVYGNALVESPDKIWFSQKARTIRDHAKIELCPKCTRSCDIAFSFRKEFFYYASFLAREKGNKLLGNRK